MTTKINAGYHNWSSFNEHKASETLQKEHQHSSEAVVYVIEDSFWKGRKSSQ